MHAKRLRSGFPGVRLGPALFLSLVLHGVLLFPWPWPRPEQPEKPEIPLPPLVATLQPLPSAPALATRVDPVEPSPPAAPLPARAVPPAQTFRESRPKPLQGRALEAAMAAMTKDEFYPRAAIERGLEGRVILLLTLDAAGVPRGIEVASGSGHPLLDDAALRAASRIGVLPVSQRQVLLPVEFRLD